MTRKALVVVAAVVVGLSTMLWPLDSAAQGRGRGSGAAAPRGGGAAAPRGGGPAPSRPVAGPGPSGQGHVAIARTAPPYGSRYYRGYGGYGGYRPYYRPYYYGGYYSPYYYGSGWGLGFGLGFGYGWGAGYYQYPYAWGYPYPSPYGYPYYSYDPTADLRLQVQPRNAEVFLDGYFVGTVDDFDGTFQRLRVPYGEHEVEVYLDGFRPIRQRMMFRPGESYNMKDAMQQLAPGEPSEPRPVAPQDPPRQPQQQYPPQQRYGPPPPSAPQQPQQPQQPYAPPPQQPYPPQRPMEPEDRGAFGTLAIRVQPSDAAITIDGERWNTIEGESRLSVDLAEGTHRVEIRKEGFRPYIAEIRIRRGEMLPLNVSLPRDN